MKIINVCIVCLTSFGSALKSHQAQASKSIALQAQAQDSQDQSSSCVGLVYWDNVVLCDLYIEQLDL